jgi:hypothetical protein
MTSDHDRLALIRVFSKACPVVALGLGILVAVVLLRPAMAAHARICAAGCAVGLATLVGWRIALWRATSGSPTGIGYPCYVGFAHVAVMAETGLAGYLVTGRLWRVFFLALAGAGLIRGLWTLGLAVFFAWQEATRARHGRNT